MDEKLVSLQISGQKNWEDQLAAGQLYVKSPIGWFVTVIGLFVFLIYALVGIVARDVRLLVILSIILTAYLCLHFSQSSRVKKRFEKDPTAASPFEMTIDNSGIKESSEHEQSEYNWAVVTRWREDDKVLLIYLTSNRFISIPKRLLKDAEKVGALKRLFSLHNVPNHRGSIILSLVTIMIYLFFLARILWPIIRSLVN